MKTPEFCPFCGLRSLIDQGGSDEVRQLECVSKECGAFFNLELFYCLRFDSSRSVI